MIDLHTHILPALDDGARTLDESLTMVRIAVDDGITCLVATPHDPGTVPDYPSQVRGRLASTSHASGVAPPQRPLRSPFGHVMGQTKAVSCKMQLPHILQLKRALLIQRSNVVNARIEADWC